MPHALRIEYIQSGRIAGGGLAFEWSPRHELLQDQAVAAAKKADVVVAFVGLTARLEGEEMRVNAKGFAGGDRTDIGLPDVQEEMIEAVAKTGKPMVVVLVNSKPLVLPPSAKRVAAILEGFNSGMEGGRALAEALFGQLNPSGKLTISIPVHVGQQPVFYSQVRGQHGDRYADLTQEPLFPFGHGLSYTQYRYSNLRLAAPTLARGQAAAVSVDVENIGQRAGDEIVQVYVTDVVTSVTWVNKALKGFARVHLAPGEKKTVRVGLPWEAFQIVDAEGRSVVEPGEFEVLVGPSSRDRDLLKATLRAE
jgi:beta-glucosidase